MKEAYLSHAFSVKMRLRKRNINIMLSNQILQCCEPGVPQGHMLVPQCLTQHKKTYNIELNFLF